MFRKTSASTLLFALLVSLAALIPSSGEAQSTPPAMVDINSAPLQAIEAIVLDNELAQRIIDNRPYANKRQLVSRRLMTTEKYDEIKDRIVARRVTGGNFSQ